MSTVILDTTDSEFALYRRQNRMRTLLQVMFWGPFLYGAVFFFCVMLMPLRSIHTGWFGVLMVAHMIAMLDLFALHLYAHVHVLQNKKIQPLAKVLWIASFWVTNGLSTFVYYLVSILPRPSYDDLID